MAKFGLLIALGLAAAATGLAAGLAAPGLNAVERQFQISDVMWMDGIFGGYICFVRLEAPGFSERALFEAEVCEGLKKGDVVRVTSGEFERVSSHLMPVKVTDAAGKVLEDHPMRGETTFRVSAALEFVLLFALHREFARLRRMRA